LRVVDTGAAILIFIDSALSPLMYPKFALNPAAVWAFQLAGPGMVALDQWSPGPYLRIYEREKEAGSGSNERERGGRILFLISNSHPPISDPYPPAVVVEVVWCLSSLQNL
jgi:hypothetical protein